MHVIPFQSRPKRIVESTLGAEDAMTREQLLAKLSHAAPQLSTAVLRTLVGLGLEFAAGARKRGESV
jgi:hypothetical protein